MVSPDEVDLDPVLSSPENECEERWRVFLGIPLRCAGSHRIGGTNPRGSFTSVECSECGWVYWTRDSYIQLPEHVQQKGLG